MTRNRHRTRAQRTTKFNRANRDALKQKPHMDDRFYDDDDPGGYYCCPDCGISHSYESPINSERFPDTYSPEPPPSHENETLAHAPALALTTEQLKRTAEMMASINANGLPVEEAKKAVDEIIRELMTTAASLTSNETLLQLGTYISEKLGECDNKLTSKSVHNSFQLEQEQEQEQNNEEIEYVNGWSLDSSTNMDVSTRDDKSANLGDTNQVNDRKSKTEVHTEFDQQNGLYGSPFIRKMKIDLYFRTEFYHAIECGDFEKVYDLLSPEPTLPWWNNKLIAPATPAALRLDGWEDVGQQDHCPYGYRMDTPLHAAIRSRQPGIADFLIEKGAPLSAVDVDDCTPLIALCQMETPHSTADVIVARKLIKGDRKNVDYKQSMTGRTALHFASMNGHFGVVDLLLFEVKAQFWVTDLKNYTPSDLASAELQKCNSTTPKKVIRAYKMILKSFERAINEKEKAEKERAAYIQKYTIMKIDQKFRSCLYQSIEDGDLNQVKNLLGPKPSLWYDVELVPATSAALRLDGWGIVIGPESPYPFWNYTPLHAAIKARESEIADFLIEKGAPLSAVDIDDCTPLITLCQLEDVHTSGEVNLARKLIKDAPRTIEHRQITTGRTPLHFAALNGHYEVVDLLLFEGKVRFLSTDLEGNTARALASSQLEICDSKTPKKILRAYKTIEYSFKRAINVQNQMEKEKAAMQNEEIRRQKELKEQEEERDRQARSRQQQRLEAEIRRREEIENQIIKIKISSSETSKNKNKKNKKKMKAQNETLPVITDITQRKIDIGERSEIVGRQTVRPPPGLSIVTIPDEQILPFTWNTSESDNNVNKVVSLTSPIESDISSPSSVHSVISSWGALPSQTLIESQDGNGTWGLRRSIWESGRLSPVLSPTPELSNSSLPSMHSDSTSSENSLTLADMNDQNFIVLKTVMDVLDIKEDAEIPSLCSKKNTPIAERSNFENDPIQRLTAFARPTNGSFF